MLGITNETAAVVSAAATAGGAIVTSLSVAVAAFVGVRSLRAQAADSHARSRPMVGAALTLDPHPSSHCADLEVRNYGQTVAYDVTVTFDPPLADTGTRSGGPSLVPFLIQRYDQTIPNLMPGTVLKNTWYILHEDAAGETVNDEPIGDRVVATIEYFDAPSAPEDRSQRRRRSRFEDRFVLDIATLYGEVRTTHTDDHLGLHKRSTQSLEAMRRDLSTIATSTKKVAHRDLSESR